MTYPTEVERFFQKWGLRVSSTALFGSLALFGYGYITGNFPPGYTAPATTTISAHVQSKFRDEDHYYAGEAHTALYVTTSDAGTFVLRGLEEDKISGLESMLAPDACITFPVLADYSPVDDKGQQKAIPVYGTIAPCN